MPVRIVSNNFDRLADNLREETATIVAETAERIETRMRSFASSRIDPTIATETERSGQRATITAGDKHQVIHAGFVEYGAAHTPARPFATPAAEAAWPLFQSRMRSLLRRGV